MTETRFTPGPWEYDGTTDQNDQAIVRSEHIEICTCWHHSVGSIEKEMHANAHLIAAAPELYEALEALKQDVVELLGPLNRYAPDGDTLEDQPIFKSVNAALRKARGETP